MTLPIQAVGLTPPPSFAGASAGVNRADAGPAFKEFLASAMQNVATQTTVSQPTSMVAKIDIEQADRALGMMLQVRDQLIDAYHQVQDIRV